MALSVSLWLIGLVLLRIETPWYTASMRMFSRFDLCWFLLIALGSSAWGAWHARGVGATFDEPFYLTKGLEFWRTGSHQPLLKAGTMPLPVDVQTLPLAIIERARGERWNEIDDFPAMLKLARSMNLPFWWTLLYFSMQLARRWGGPFAGRVALLLVGFEPNLLAHARLATTDIPLAASVLASIHLLLNGENQRWVWRVFLPGFAWGLALGCKVSALPFVGLAWLFLMPPRNRRDWLDGFARLGIAFAVVFILCGCDWRCEPTFVKWAEGLPDSPLATMLRRLAENSPLFSNAGEGIVQQFKHNLRGHGCYVLGEWNPRAVWYYFPVILGLKSSEPSWFLLAGLLLKPKSLWNPATRFAGALLIFSLSCRVQIGIRLVFPLVVFIQLMLAVGVGRFSALKNRSPLTPGRSPKTIELILLATALLLGSAPTLTHINRFWGQRPEVAFADSNCDWGQGLPELKAWAERNGETNLSVWYYGTDPAVFRPPFQLRQVHSDRNPSLSALRQGLRGKLLAVGQSHFTGCPDRRRKTHGILDWLRGRSPVAVVGTFAIYRFPDDPTGE